MLEIWGRPYSSNVIPVIWTANELRLEYRLHLAGGSFGKLDTDAYAQINPNRMIPAIRDGNFALWESLSIIRYLSDCYGAGTLSPADPQTRAIADQWMEWSASRAFLPVIYLFFATVRTAPDRRDPQKIADLRDEAHAALSILEAHLGDRAYVAGDRFSMGDIPWAASPTGTLPWRSSARPCPMCRPGTHGWARAAPTAITSCGISGPTPMNGPPLKRPAPAKGCCSMDLRDYRRALGSFPTGVTIVTALDAAGDPWGVTVNSFTSVSLDPPVVSVCIGKQGRVYAAFAAAEAFAINILSGAQQALALHFAGKVDNRFADTQWHRSPGGTPFLPGTAARLHCDVSARIDAGDHEILLGRVSHYDHRAVPPLGYCRGMFFSAQTEEPSHG